MSQDESFSALFEASSAEQGGQRSRLRAGERVQGTVVAMSNDTVFVDVGGRVEAHLSRSEILDKNGEPTVSVGDTIKATVAKAGRGAPELKMSLGRGEAGTAELELAAQSGTPVEGTFSKAVKAGLEVDISGKRAFCPASQVDVQFVKELDTFVGQSHFFKVLEVRDNGRSIVVSRRALLEAERAEKAKELVGRLEVGAELEGIVQSLQAYGAFVDIGGIQGLLHISEISTTRIGSPSDVLSVGETVKVQVKSIESQADGKPPKIGLSMKALIQGAGGGSSAAGTEIVTATVDKVESYGVLVSTEAGAGMIPNAELDLPPNADPRRRYKAGTEIQVVAMRPTAQGKLRFSIKAVAQVEEKQAFAKFRSSQKKGSGGGKKGSLGSLGDLLAGIDLGGKTKG
ncbi:MAG: S1 RNA-binding domain-containing protein [Myxococcota bacterium]